MRSPSRASRLQVRLVAAAALAVLGASSAVAALDAGRQRAAAAPAVAAAATPRPAPAPARSTSGPAAASSAGYRDPLLGPPPGPQDDPRPGRTAAPQDRYALLLGVTRYPRGTEDTIGGAGDVLFIRDRLLRAGWLPQNVRVLTDGQVTGAAVRRGMAWLAAQGRPGTFTLFHWSGHVRQMGGSTEALWPVDRDWVRDREVTSALSQVAGHLWVDVAGCEAGSFLPGLPSDRVLVSASSKATEKSYEYPAWGRSVWTGLVFDLGLGQGQADADHDGRVTMGEALRYSTYYAQKITRIQRPYGRQTPQVEGDPVRGWTLDAPPA